MSQLNLALRFALEVAAIAAIAYWGYHAAEGAARWVLAVGAPIALIIVWASVIAPGAQNPIPQEARVVLGSGLLLVAAGLLFVAGQQTPALVLAGLVLVNTVLMFVLGH